MGIFGWSYPPGAAGDPNAPWNQEDGPCEVCGNDVDHCICPECPECGEHGNPRCYEDNARGEDVAPGHGLRRTPEQVLSLAWAQALDEEASRSEAEYWAKHQNDDY